MLQLRRRIPDWRRVDTPPPLARVRCACQYSAHAWTGRQGDQPHLTARAASRCVPRAPSPRRPRHSRVPPHRYPRRQRRSSLRGVSLPRALPVRRAHGRSRDDPQRQLPCADGRRPRGLGIRVDDARQRLGLPRGAARRRARRHDRAGDRAAAQTAACDEAGHPIDLFRALEPAYLRAADAVSRARALATPMPKLCTLVVASAFDAAIHDAYGKAFGVSCYETYGPRFMRRDLSQDLGPAVQGRVSGSLRAVRAPADDAGVPLRRGVRSARGRPMCGRGSTMACPTRSRSGLHATACSPSR